MVSLSARRVAAVVILFIATSSGLILLDQQQRLDTLKGPATTLVQPFADALSRLGQRISSVVGGDTSDAASQLEQVTAERDRLLAENARLKQLEQEVNQLRQQLGFQQAYPQLATAPANVIGHDPDGVRRMIVIDRGAEDGIREGMAVVSPDYFIGQVTEVEAHRSQVTLVIDATCQIGASVQRSGAEGVVYGRWQAGGWLDLRHLDPAADVAEGDVVVTSGRTALVPPGLVIGKVYAVDREQQADTLTASVSPLIDFSQLRVVTVILNSGS